MKGYKGYSKGLVCLGKQYEVGKTYEEEDANICRKGMHFCENPLEVFKYYPPVNDHAELNEYTEVEALDEPVTDGSGKFATTKLKVERKLSIYDLVDDFVEFTQKREKEKEIDTGYCSSSTNTEDRSSSTNTGHRSTSTNTGDYSASTNTGYCSASTNTGERSTSANTGYCSASTNTGYRSSSTNTGDYSASTNTGSRSLSTNTGYYSASTNKGCYSASTNTGDYSLSTNTGDCSVSTNTGSRSLSTNTGYRSTSANTGSRSLSTNTGYYSVSTNTGRFASSANTGKNGVAIAWGFDSKARGTKGCYLVLAEYDDDYNFVVAKMRKVDGKTIKENVFYKLKNGKFVESED